MAPAAVSRERAHDGVEHFLWNDVVVLGVVTASLLAIVYYMSSGGAYAEVEVPWEVAPEQWVHLAGTWDGALLTLWIDGQEVGTTESPAFEFDEQPIFVGADDDHAETGPEGFFAGGIDDVRLYRRALAADEIAALAAG